MANTNVEDKGKQHKFRGDKTTNTTSEGKRVEKVDGKDKDNEAAAHSQQGPSHSVVSRVDLPEWDL